MAPHGLALWITLAAIPYGAAAQPAPARETWSPTSRTAQSVTGKITFTPSQIIFQNGTPLALSRGVQMLFRPDKKKKVMVDLYSVTHPENPVLENGKTLCNGKAAAYLLVWKSEKVGADVDPRSMNVFSSAKFVSGSPDDCGRYMYDAGAR